MLAADRGATGTEAKITLSLRCNNDCVFCYNREDKEEHEALEEALVLGLIDEAAARGCDSLNFIGGEVTILPYFLRVLAYAGERFERVSINSNGRRFCDRAFAEACVDAGLTNVDVSLHGAEPVIHDGVSRTHGAFEQTTAGLRNLATLRDEGRAPSLRLSVTTLVLDWTYPHLAALGPLLAALGVTGWRIKYAYGALGGGVERAANDYIPAYREALPFVLEALETCPGCVDAVVHDVPLCLLGERVGHSTGFDRHAVARYTAEGPEDAVRVVDKWGTVSTRCAECVARPWCCQVSPAYHALHGDSELRPFDATAWARLVAAGETAPARGARDGGGAGAGAPVAVPAPTLDFAPIDAAARARDWRAVRSAAVELLARYPEQPEAERMRRLAESHLLDEEASRLATAGDHKRARKVRRYLERHYADVAR
jgi:hypothetical protein